MRCRNCHCNIYLKDDLCAACEEAVDDDGITFEVHGIPATQGSKVAVRRRNGGTPVLLDTNRATLKPWRSLVTETACTYLAALAIATETAWAPYDGPLAVVLDFTFLRPASHPKRRRTWPTGRNDIDKLSRAILDALTDAGVWRDDGQVVDLRARKDYGPRAGVRATVTRVIDEQ